MARYRNLDTGREFEFDGRIENGAREKAKAKARREAQTVALPQFTAAEIALLAKLQAAGMLPANLPTTTTQPIAAPTFTAFQPTAPRRTADAPRSKGRKSKSRNKVRHYTAKEIAASRWRPGMPCPFCPTGTNNFPDGRSTQVEDGWVVRFACGGHHSVHTDPAGIPYYAHAIARRQQG